MRPTLRAQPVRPRCGGIKDPDAEDDDLDMKDVSPAEAAAEAAKAEGTSFTDAESMALITWVSKTNGKGWWEGTTSAAAKALKKEEAQSAVQTVRGVKRTVKQVVARWQNMRSTYNTIKQAMQKSGAAAYDGKNAWFVSMDILMTEREAQVPATTLEAGAGKLQIKVAGPSALKQEEKDGKVVGQTATAKAAALQAELRLQSGGGAPGGGKKAKALAAVTSAALQPLMKSFEENNNTLRSLNDNIAALVGVLGGKGVTAPKPGASSKRTRSKRDSRPSTDPSDPDSDTASDDSDADSGLSGLSAEALRKKMRKMMRTSKS